MQSKRIHVLIQVLWGVVVALGIAPHRAVAAAPTTRPEFEAAPVHSTWEDLLEGVTTIEQWRERKAKIRRQFLELIRDDRKPARPPLDLQVHETVDVEGLYTRKLISYNVEADERAHAYLEIMRVYELEKAPQNFAFYVHGRGHSAAYESRQLIAAWMDVHLKPPSATETKLVGSK